MMNLCTEKATLAVREKQALPAKDYQLDVSDKLRCHQLVSEKQNLGMW